MTQVLILGAGYAGTMAANRLAGAADGPSVIVVNPRAEFVERIRLHQYIVDGYQPERPLRELLHPAVSVVVGEVDLIDADHSQVTLTDGRVLDYDFLIYAVGSTSNVPTNAYSIAALDDARDTRDRLRALPADADVVVVGAGTTGMEAAAEIAEQTGLTVTLIGTAVAPSFAATGRRKAERTLRRLGVNIVTGTVETVEDGKVVLRDGRVVASDATIFTTGFTVPTLAARSGLPVDAIGRLRTDDTLRVVDVPTVVAAGDACAPVAPHIRMSCAAAIPLGAQAADVLLASLRGEAPTAVDQGFAAQCASLGRHGGVLQTVRPDDVPRALAIGGKAAALVKEQICRYTVKWLATEARHSGKYAWPRGPKGPVA